MELLEIANTAGRRLSPACQDSPSACPSRTARAFQRCASQSLRRGVRVWLTALVLTKQLRLPTLGDQFARLAEEAVKEKQSHLSYLEALLEAEVEERDRKAMARRIQEARFPSVKTLEEFDFQSAPHIPAALVRNLSEGGYL